MAKKRTRKRTAKSSTPAAAVMGSPPDSATSFVPPLLADNMPEAPPPPVTVSTELERMIAIVDELWKQSIGVINALQALLPGDSGPDYEFTSRQFRILRDNLNGEVSEALKKLLNVAARNESRLESAGEEIVTMTRAARGSRT